MTCEECIKVLDVKHEDFLMIHTYRSEQLRALQQLLICRDAWWKVDNDWKPDWKDGEAAKYCVTQIGLDMRFYEACTFAFRTEEIRDKFLETFRELIESCKELI